jgi:hypothetical protein
MYKTIYLFLRFSAEYRCKPSHTTPMYHVVSCQPEVRNPIARARAGWAASHRRVGESRTHLPLAAPSPSSLHAQEADEHELTEGRTARPAGGRGRIISPRCPAWLRLCALHPPAFRAVPQQRHDRTRPGCPAPKAIGSGRLCVRPSKQATGTSFSPGSDPEAAAAPGSGNLHGPEPPATGSTTICARARARGTGRRTDAPLSSERVRPAWRRRWRGGAPRPWRGGAGCARARHRRRGAPRRCPQRSSCGWNKTAARISTSVFDLHAYLSSPCLPPFPLLLARPPRARRNASVPPASAPDAIMLGSCLGVLSCLSGETLALCLVCLFFYTSTYARALGKK